MPMKVSGGSTETGENINIRQIGSDDKKGRGKRGKSVASGPAEKQTSEGMGEIVQAALSTARQVQRQRRSFSFTFSFGAGAGYPGEKSALRPDT